jgi:hypothetical protein
MTGVSVLFGNLYWARNVTFSLFQFDFGTVAVRRRNQTFVCQDGSSYTLQGDDAIPSNIILKALPERSGAAIRSVCETHSQTEFVANSIFETIANEDSQLEDPNFSSQQLPRSVTYALWDADQPNTYKVDGISWKIGSLEPNLDIQVPYTVSFDKTQSNLDICKSVSSQIAIDGRINPFARFDNYLPSS